MGEKIDESSNGKQLYDRNKDGQQGKDTDVLTLDTFRHCKLLRTKLLWRR